MVNATDTMYQIKYDKEQTSEQQPQEILQYSLTSNKCKDSIIFLEKCEAEHNKLFHERYFHYRVSMSEQIWVTVEGGFE